MAKKDFYDVLGVPKGADNDVIKKAYRKIAMDTHPDRNPGDKKAEERFKEAAEAYEILSNPDKKARYDRYGHAGVDPQAGYSGRSGGMTMDDIFENFGDIFGDSGSPFESFFGGRSSGGGRSTGQKGSNLRIKVSLTLEEIATGISKKIKVKKQVTCKTCHGSGAKDAKSVKTCGTCNGSGYVRQIKNTFLGQMQTTTACPTCNGTGQQISANCGNCRGSGSEMGEETIEIQIPAGIEDNMQLSMRGKGNAGSNGGPNGDLLISIEQKEHESFSRDGMNIHYDLYINFADAALGHQIEVPTLNSAVKIKIPPGTQSGKIFRLKGIGLPAVQSYEKGDQLVHINIWTPKTLTNEEKAIMEKMKTMTNFQPHPSSEEKGFFDRMKEFFHN
ncbi:MAG: molecular chaperone DnaJ [Saprospiraceae bacterium]|jgi:molecular chaperone DnaJ|uniref:Chaperone protein DnaJ n=1 Tax=Candidatus Defluviibacterium haderslevense TaxID=2981993 RepID=A0A9D7S7Q0_9BACT|nr:molecular chaperone DnaJ [Candidatus Defluviibacterium haderslevense]MBP6523597.1 molecular chaperone DnaJ [Saprospiraceae bacterium]MBK7243033.1 molecular chaperone DnaJ [Candidatus Defluviibacterium haderslevense]MBK8243070.1 molecular chaperone DnaJ [Candidatus Defluviibacterium haderslevense]MBK9716344.1 molecular chaperone DnaJ [Candidatus Defluviibacterium haderslevense]